MSTVDNRGQSSVVKVDDRPAAATTATAVATAGMLAAPIPDHPNTAVRALLAVVSGDGDDSGASNFDCNAVDSVDGHSQLSVSPSSDVIDLFSRLTGTLTSTVPTSTRSADNRTVNEARLIGDTVGEPPRLRPTAAPSRVVTVDTVQAPSSPLANVVTDSASNQSTSTQPRPSGPSHGYHPATLVHLSVYCPELADASPGVSLFLPTVPDGHEEKLTELEEALDRRQILYCFDREYLDANSNSDGDSDGSGNSRNREHDITKEKVASSTPLEGVNGLSAVPPNGPEQENEINSPNSDSAQSESENADGGSGGGGVDTKDMEGAAQRISEERARKRWNTRLRKVGLAQALAQFCGAFTDSPHLDNVHSQQHRWTLLSPEPGFWILALCHGRFRTLTDSDRSHATKLRTRLAEHFDGLVGDWHFDRPDICTALNGIQLAPLSQTSYDAAVQLTNDTRRDCSFIEASCLLWRTQLVTSDVSNPTELRALWQLLVRQYVRTPEKKEAKTHQHRPRQHQPQTRGGSWWLGTNRRPVLDGSTVAGHDEGRWNPTSLFRTITPSFLLRPGMSSEPDPDGSSLLQTGGDDTGTASSIEGSVSSVGSAIGVTDEDVIVEDNTDNGGENSMGQCEFLTGSIGSGALNREQTQGLKEATTPYIHLLKNEEMIPYYLIILQCPPDCLFALVAPCSAIDESSLPEFYRTLHTNLATRLEAVAHQLTQERTEVEQASLDRFHSFRFAHLDRTTLFVHSNLTQRRVRSDVRECLLDMHQTFQRDPDVRELCNRLSISGRWILARRDDRREVYFVIDRKDASLVQVEEEFRRFSAIDIGQVI